MDTKIRPYGFVNGKAVYSRDEFIFAKRCFGAIESDEELMAYAEKVTWGWQASGHRRTFEDFYLSDYALSSPYQDLTAKEFNRLKELQKEAREKAKAEDEAREWKFVERICWADNSVEEIYVDKNGEKKSVMVEFPHGDVCF